MILTSPFERYPGTVTLPEVLTLGHYKALRQHQVERPAEQDPAALIVSPVYTPEGELYKNGSDEPLMVSWTVDSWEFARTLIVDSTLEVELCGGDDAPYPLAAWLTPAIWRWLDEQVTLGK